MKNRLPQRICLCHAQTNHKPQTTNHKPQTTNHKPRLAFNFGFTLAELLVSLAVLGLIAGLTVPSIVTSVEKSKRKAIFKESLSTLANVLTNQRNLGFDPWETPTDYWKNIQTSLNAPAMSGTEYHAPGISWPCKPSTICQGWISIYKQSNGSYLGFTTSGMGPVNIHLFIDANGPGQPNIVGEDRLQVSVSPQKGNLVDSNNYGIYPPESRTPNKLLFDSLF